MQVQVDELRPYLQAFDFQNLLVEGLGWDYYRADPVSVHVDAHDYTLEPAAEKAGFVVYVCGPGADSYVPPYPVRRKIESQVAKLAYEHLIIFIDADKTLQVWQWVRRESGKPAACREQTFHAGQTGEALLQRLQPLFVSLDEEPSLNIALVASRVRAALDVEKVTKQFYERFRAELTAFQNFISGITALGDREWYSSLMLNRMMFVYFVQKQGFLDGDPDYLRNKLNEVRRDRGEGKFQLFYYEFLRRLFHEGLGQHESARDPDLNLLLGKVPFLNGGLFDVHDLERDNPGITIPDEAFERVFNFFDGYRWHLDERPRREDNEINPDVLGYIFEKYVNQKQMGAYYTKEDITGYITRNTVIPFLFDAAKKECPVAFNPGGGVWRLLQDDPDRYIYPAVGHGMAWSYSTDADSLRLEQALELPEDIAVGLDDVSQRSGWNRPAPEEYALPTETWREVVARHRRYQEVWDKLAAGEVSDINDLITLNLDVEQFALDVIVQSEGPELLRAFWHGLTGVSVLDPTCGSGAFLFAALNILEPLYTACLEGMHGFVEDLERTRRPQGPQALSDFRGVLKDAGRHPSQRYFILKFIVLNNLYGVDIMEEAVEICKLRLFLKLVAQLESYDQIEPLPDIDFNIRPGNTLVGFTSLDAVRRAMTITDTLHRPMPEVRRAVRGKQARAMFAEDQATLDRIQEEAEIASRAFDQFREQQTALGGEVTTGDKAALRYRMDSLRDELDRYLATEYGGAIKDSTAYARWRASHQPFHWFVEFYGIMSKGGFDVVIGNPPYVEYSKVKGDYTVKSYETERCGNTYALCSERALHLTTNTGRFCFIVPLSVQTTKRMSPLQEFLLGTDRELWMSSFDVYPCKLFDGAKQRLTILLASRKVRHSNTVWTTRYLRWRPEERPALFARLAYTPSHRQSTLSVFPKSDDQNAASILDKVARFRPEAFSQSRGKHIYVHRIPYNYVKAVNFVPYFMNEFAGRKKSDDYKPYCLASSSLNSAALAIINSNLFFFRWYSFFEGYHCGRHEITSFPFGFSRMTDEVRIQLELLAGQLMADLERNSRP